jgi:3-oxoacyl-[acyl-carrier protein] reductase
MLAKTFADELGPRGVRVFGLLPGSFVTTRNQRLFADPELANRRLAEIPLGRFGDPDEFGAVAAFTLSPMASYITGSVITVDGGVVRGY